MTRRPHPAPRGRTHAPSGGEDRPHDSRATGVRPADDLERRLDALARRHWPSDGADLTRLTLGAGADAITLYAPPAAAAALTDTLTAAGTALRNARAEVVTLRARVAALEEAARAPAGKQRAAVATTLADVPPALIAPFRPDARAVAAAKENPLVALAVQATKAMQADASELERARLLAMAYAASTGDMARFWTARAQRSAKKPSGR